MSMTRFSTTPSPATSTTSACAADSGTKATCFSTGSCLGTRTRPAQADRPDSAAVACASALSLGPPPARLASLGQASCGERVGQFVYVPVVGVTLTPNKNTYYT